MARRIGLCRSADHAARRLCLGMVATLRTLSGGVAPSSAQRLPAGRARPMWSADIDAGVLFARIVPEPAVRADLVDLLRIRPLVAAIIDGRDTEHLLFSDGRHALRVDIVGGTLVGAPALLAYRLAGLSRVRRPLRSLQRLLALMSDRRFATTLDPPEARAARWILELRVADALRAGASQQDIARVLYERVAAETQWRLATPAIRSRVQRLVRTARLRQGAHPITDWFDCDTDNIG
jgi:hypothetical protein